MAKLPGWLVPAIGALIAIAIGAGILLYVHAHGGEDQTGYQGK
jgi:hypothetical protein